MGKKRELRFPLIEEKGFMIVWLAPIYAIIALMKENSPFGFWFQLACAIPVHQGYIFPPKNMSGLQRQVHNPPAPPLSYEPAKENDSATEEAFISIDPRPRDSFVHPQDRSNRNNHRGDRDNHRGDRDNYRGDRDNYRGDRDNRRGDRDNYRGDRDQNRRHDSSRDNYRGGGGRGGGDNRGRGGRGGGYRGGGRGPKKPSKTKKVMPFEDDQYQ